MDHTDSERSTEVTSDTAPEESTGSAAGAKRRRGSRGGQRRRGSGPGSGLANDDVDIEIDDEVDDRNDVELPEPMSQGRPSAEAAEKALVRKPRIGDTMPMPTTPPPGPAAGRAPADDDGRSGSDTSWVSRAPLWAIGFLVT